MQRPLLDRGGPTGIHKHVLLLAQSVGERRAAQEGGLRSQKKAGTGLGRLGRQKPTVSL